jgi:predicted ATPase/DNA-binding SARP family transcriptional activator
MNSTRSFLDETQHRSDRFASAGILLCTNSGDLGPGYDGAMLVRILGPLEVSSDLGSPSIGGTKQRIVLACLALRIGRVMPVDELIEAGWGDDLPANPANALQYQVAKLRKIIETDAAHPQYLVTSKPGYRLDPGTVTTDAEQFEATLAAARQAFAAGDNGRAAPLVDEALALWRGQALAEFRYDDFARADAERLDDERVAAIELQLDIALADGRHAEASPHLAQLTRQHPLREGLWARRVLALYRSGRQSEALRVLRDARDALAEVGLEPGTDLRALEQQIIDQDSSLDPEATSARAPSHNLPAPPNRLVGREADLDKISELVEAGRLVTLIGPGGAGKTRLAIAVGRALLDRYPGGIWFLPLDTLEDGSLLPAAIGRVIGMREIPDRPVVDTLVDHLSGQRMMLVLDNCEHLIESVATFVGKMMARCDLLSVLATSQVTLESAGEVVFAVTPLTSPGQTASIYDPISEIDGVTLFLERARDAGTRVEDWDNAAIAAVANIVTAIDGMPLALELAAARTRSMSLDEIARGLDDRFAILSHGPRTAPARQRSLRAAVEWSLNLLEDRQRTLIAKLAVFTGGFDTEDAAAVAGESPLAIRDDLAALVDRSLLTRSADVAGSARYAMLESLRQYGTIELGADQLTSARDAHLAHFARFATEVDAGIRSSDQVSWLHRIDAAYANIRAAMGWSLDGGSLETGIRLAARMGRYWDWRGLLKEGTAWTERFTAAAGAPVPGLATIQAGRSFMAWESGDLDEARQASDLAIVGARELGDPLEVAAALMSQLFISRVNGDTESARSEGAALSLAADRAGDPWIVAWVESMLATVALAANDLDAAESHADRSRLLFAELGDRRGESWGLIALAQICLGHGDADAAELNARSALAAATATEDDRSMLWALEILADTAQRRGEPERSARLWGATDPLRESRGLTESVSKLSAPTDLGTLLGEELGEVFPKLVESGRRDPNAAIAEELQALKAATSA